MPHDRRPVEHGDEPVVRVAGVADQRDDAGLVVVAVDPLKAAAVEVALVQRGLRAVQAVQILDELLQARVQRLAQKSDQSSESS